MKKLVILAVALLLVPVSAMAGMTAFTNMDELSSKEMATVTGQSGITVDLNNTAITSGSIYWTDDDGLPAAYPSEGVVKIALGQVTTGVASLDIDAGTVNADKTYVILTMGAATLNATVNSITLGSTEGDADAGKSFGKIHVKDLVLNNTEVAISAH